MPKICAYCGNPADTLDHVLPKGLYPPSKRKNNPTLLTVPACKNCNMSFSDDEEHFRNVITCAGKNTQSVTELFFNKVHPSFAEGKSLRHFRQLIDLMEDDETEERKIIYPMNDRKFVRILTKIFQGLGYYHFNQNIPNEIITIEVLPYELPPEIFGEARWYEHEPEIFRYLYEVYKINNDYESFWIVEIHQTRRFVGRIKMLEEMKFERNNCVDLSY